MTYYARDWVMPRFTALETKDAATIARHRPHVAIFGLDHMVAVRSWTPLEQRVALKKNWKHLFDGDRHEISTPHHAII